MSDWLGNWFDFDDAVDLNTSAEGLMPRPAVPASQPAWTPKRCPLRVAACHARGALLSLDVSQCCDARPLHAAQLGADFLNAAGYEWLLSP
jgi:hypothetical protein